MEKVTEFVIDRSKWTSGGLRGVGSERDCFCALGHYALVCGVPDAEILRHDNNHVVYPAMRELFDNDFAEDIYHANDVDRTESAIAEAFAGYGVKVEFTGAAVREDLLP